MGKDLDKMIDNISDFMHWIDMVGLRMYMAGQLDEKVPVEWARDRMANFMDRLMTEFTSKNRTNKN